MANQQSFLSKLKKLLSKEKQKPADLPNHNEQNLRFEAWFKDDGDKTHRLNYDLDSSSVVFDLGGYEGQWASDIYAKYNCTVYIFEPFIPYAEKIKLRFKSNPNIRVFDFGLANETKTTHLAVNGNASSMFKQDAEMHEIKLFKADDFLKEHNINFINLMKINIEGGEFDLLGYLLEKKLVGKIENIQVQFHNFVPDAEKRMLDIQEKLQLTHSLTYQYTFVWENWALRK